MQEYTTFIRDADGATHINYFTADDCDHALEQALDFVQSQNMGERSDLFCLGCAKGRVEIIMWDDGI